MEDGVIYEVRSRRRWLVGRVGLDGTIGVRWRREFGGRDRDVEDGKGGAQTRLRRNGLGVGAESEAGVVA